MKLQTILFHTNRKIIATEVAIKKALLTISCLLKRSSKAINFSLISSARYTQIDLRTETKVEENGLCKKKSQTNEGACLTVLSILSRVLLELLILLVSFLPSGCQLKSELKRNNFVQHARARHK